MADVIFKIGDKIRRKKGTSYYPLEGIVTKIDYSWGDVFIKETKKGTGAYSCSHSFSIDQWELAPRNLTFRQAMEILDAES